MSQVFTVRVIEEMLVTYEVEVDSKEDITDETFINREPGDKVREVYSEYYDFDRIYDATDDKGEEVSL